PEVNCGECCIRSAMSRGDDESTPHPERSVARHRSPAGLRMGDDGHRTIALIAEQYLEPAVKTKIAAVLDADPKNLTAHDLASEAPWADKYKESNIRRVHYERTQNWHFVDLEIDDPDIKAACFGRPPLPPGTLASNGPAKACGFCFARGRGKLRQGCRRWRPIRRSNG